LFHIFWIASLCRISSLRFDSVAAIILVKYPIKQIAVAAYVAAIIITFLWDASKLFAVVVPGIAGALYIARIGNTPLFNSDNIYQFSPKMNN
jgi:hypothetical protein